MWWRQTESKFHQVPYETGRYRFCLTVSELHHSARYTLPREVVWDLHLVNQVDQQLQQLRATQTYIYWRERRHRQTVDSTNKRVLWYAIARAAALVTVSVVQVLGVRYMFRSK
ncbi:GOLD domain-containing protein [Haematococcus lacustris]|uniref:GOLD domain-containing protein n=1 Tax=Haematococcus lacustris TaxID=44745 RepID=A0A699Z064_HAELA|nr:GOLD domain-containing protein [Haematococcus lacustris]